MAGVEHRNLDAPDETRTPDKSPIAVVKLAGGTATRKTLQSGRRWADCIRPIVRTDRCQVHHVGVALSGQLHVEHRDGSAAQIRASDVYIIEPGHEAWVVGDEPFVGMQFDNLAAALFAGD